MHVLVLGLLLLLALDPAALEGAEVTAALETEGGDQTLDFGTGQTSISMKCPRDFKSNDIRTPWCRASRSPSSGS